ncbi:MAG: DNA repair protein RecN [Exilispira sp.]
MLKRIYIKNYALIREIEVNFDNGLSIISGETGAGKSILINSLYLAFGEAIDTTFLLNKEDPIVVEIDLDLPDKRIKEEGKEYGLDLDKDEITIRRIYNPKTAKNSYLVNDIPVPRIFLSSIFKNTVELVGQHENSKLLNISSHIDLLDLFARIKDEVVEFTNSFNLLKKKEDELLKLKKTWEDQTKRIDYLNYAISEIERINPKIEEESLYEERKKLAQGEKIVANLSDALSYLKSQGSGLNRLFSIKKTIDELTTYDSTLSKISQNFQDAYILLQDTEHEISSYLEKIDFSEEHIRYIDERLDQLELLKKKYGNTIEEILKIKNQYEQEISNYDTLDEKIEKLNNEISNLKQKLAHDAIVISQKRRVAARELEIMVNENLKKVGMDASRFAVSIDYQQDENSFCKINGSGYKINSNGIDIVEFGLSSSPSLPVKSLRKIASGGEISRIMLAIKKALIEYEEAQTIIFDEIDAGIGGKTADLVGNEIYQISKDRQIICITHLPQIASYATNHYNVLKNIEGKDVYISIKKLDKDERIIEIARMLSGQPDSHQALEHARQLLNEKNHKINL